MGEAASSLAPGCGEDSRPSSQLQAELVQWLWEYSNDCNLLGGRRGGTVALCSRKGQRAGKNCPEKKKSSFSQELAGRGDPGSGGGTQRLQTSGEGGMEEL